MNARLLGLFSGFPSRRFPRSIAQRLQEELHTRDHLVLISAWPSEHDRNDSDAAGMHGMFAEYDMSFKQYTVIDNRTEPANAQQLIRDASCIFLMGGHATQQYALICEKGIREELRRSTAVILGVSAGSSNMARRALDVWESHVPYEGLGLTDITIKAHVQPEDPKLLQTLVQISIGHRLPICAMEDNSAIFVKNGHASFLGNIHWVNEGKVSPLSMEILEKLIAG